MRSLKLLCSMIFTFALSFNAYASGVAKDVFPPTLQLGDLDWTLDNQQQDASLALAEYITKSEKVSNWSQLLTFQKFKFDLRPQASPQLFANSEYQQLKKLVPDAQFNIISATANEGIVEFRVTKPKEKQQDELQRIIISPNHKLIVIHYVINKPDMGSDQRKKWIDALKGIDLPFMKDSNIAKK